MASYVAMRDTLAQPYIAVPVFPHRRFRHSYLFVNSSAHITSPKDVPIDPSAAGGFRLRRVEDGKDVDGMLVEGEIEGLLYPDLPPSFRSGDPRMRRMWPDR